MTTKEMNWIKNEQTHTKRQIQIYTLYQDLLQQDAKLSDIVKAFMDIGIMIKIHYEDMPIVDRIEHNLEDMKNFRDSLSERIAEKEQEK